MRTLLLAVLLFALVIPTLAQKGDVEGEPLVEDIFEFEEMPRYPGGIEALSDYLNKVAQPTKGIGMVTVKAYINPYGKISRVEVEESSGNVTLDEAAIEHINNMPDWEPGTYRLDTAIGNVHAVVFFPISFPCSTTHMKHSNKENNGGEAEVFTIVEEMPEFPGGQQELMQYLASITYPEEAINKGYENTVFARFVVGKCGYLTVVEIAKSKGYFPLDLATLLHILNSPRWKPGYQRGKSVKVQYVVPIRFSLN